MLNFPKAVWVAVGLVALIAVGAFVIGPPPEKGPSTSAEALSDSGAETVQVTDPVHGRPFDVSVWAPTGTDDRNELVVISHGFSGDRTSHNGLAAMLVADGYTVAAPTHPDMAGLESGDERLDPLTLRPRHLSLTISALEESDGAAYESITAIGHSLGGYSALRLTGAQPTLDGTLDAHCETTDDRILCSKRAISRFETVAGNGDDFSDARVDRVILLAPGYGPLFGQDEMALDAEVLIVAARDDDELPGGQVADLIDQLGPGANSSTVDGGHFVFLRPCTDVEVVAVPAICEDPDDVDRVAVHAELAAQIRTFVQA